MPRPACSSRTASLMVLFRALASAGITGVRDFSDPVAANLLPRRLSQVVHKVEDAIRRRPGLRARLRSRAGGFDVIALRTKALDQVVATAVAAGCRQVAILGAGLDSRAWRLDLLKDATVFEVDRAESQAVKRERTAPLLARAGSVRFVAADLVFDEWWLGLAAEGHDPQRPTCWLVEGVLPYLPPYTVARLLRQLAGASAAGSTVAATFIPEQPEAHLVARATLAAVRVVFKRLGEPFASMLGEDQLSQMLAEAGWCLTEMSDLDAWSARYSEVPPKGAMLFREKLAVAQR